MAAEPNESKIIRLTLQSTNKPAQASTYMEEQSDS